jgi:serine/threonine-protein kinase
MDELIELAGDARAVRMAQIRTEEPLLADELTDLMARFEAVPGPGFLEGTAFPGDATLTGRKFGNYTLVRPIGQGGMSTVWLAERSDGSFEGRVAVKLLNLALVWRAGTERFRREGNLLARLAHPHIAHLIDAGVATDGQPYLVLEYVEGEPIDQWCERRHLDVASKVRLFLDVLEAVGHAHNNLVLHRDLKPSNILVTPDGQVKLLDFGVATLLDAIEQPVPPSELTRSDGRVFTPAYAAPEQVLGNSVSTATDVYSLGVLLYQILSGRHPTSGQSQTPGEVLRRVIDTDPVRLSDAASSTAGAGSAELKGVGELRGDLDNIVGKALKKDAAERYPTSAALADDLRRYLNDEPVSAHADSFGYRARKFLRRRRLEVALGGAATAALVIGLATALWQADVARAETKRAGQVKVFVASIFEQAVPRQGIGGAPNAVELLTSATERIERELSTQPRVAAELGIIIGKGFSALGEPLKGLAALQAAVPRAEAEFGRRHPLTLQGKLLLAESVEIQDVTAAERLLAQTMPDLLAGLPANAAEAVTALRRHSFLLAKRNDEERAYAALEQAIEIGGRHLGPDAEDTIEAIGLLSNTYARFNKYDQQLRTAAEAERRALAAYGAKRPHALLAAVDRWYADALRNNDRPAEAIPILRRVLKDQLALDTTKTPRVRSAMLSLALALARVGRLDEALGYSAEALALEAAQNSVDSDDRVGYGANHANLLMQARRTDEAWMLHQRISEVERKLGTRTNAGLVGDHIRESRLLAMRGDGHGATRAALQAVADAEKYAKHAMPEAWLAASFNARMQGSTHLAVEYAQRAAQVAGTLPTRFGVAALVASELGCALLDAGETEKAAVVLSEASQAFATAQVEPSIQMADSLVCEARLALQAGNPIKAEQLLRPLLLSWESTNPGSEWHAETLLWLTKAQLLTGTAPLKLQGQRERALAMLSKAPEPSLRKFAAEERGCGRFPGLSGDRSCIRKLSG